jgi:hypothetical protein
MDQRYTWDERKRRINLSQHKLDFADADMVLNNPLKLEVASPRKGEHRIQAFAYVFEVLTVLSVAYQPGEPARIISFRRAKRSERDAYHEWLETEFHDPE